MTVMGVSAFERFFRAAASPTGHQGAPGEHPPVPAPRPGGRTQTHPRATGETPPARPGADRGDRGAIPRNPRRLERGSRRDVQDRLPGPQEPSDQALGDRDEDLQPTALTTGGKFGPIRDAGRRRIRTPPNVAEASPWITTQAAQPMPVTPAPTPTEATTIPAARAVTIRLKQLPHRPSQTRRLESLGHPAFVPMSPASASPARRTSLCHAATSAGAHAPTSALRAIQPTSREWQLKARPIRLTARPALGGGQDPRRLTAGRCGR